MDGCPEVVSTRKYLWHQPAVWHPQPPDKLCYESLLTLENFVRSAVCSRHRVSRCVPAIEFRSLDKRDSSSTTPERSLMLSRHAAPDRAAPPIRSSVSFKISVRALFQLFVLSCVGNGAEYSDHSRFESPCTMTQALQPQLKWAQRKDKLYLTVDLQDCDAPEVNVTNEDGGGKFEFRGASKGSQYELTVPLMHEVDPENTQIAKTPRNIFLVVPKKEEGDHWPRLTREKGKQNHIQVDWSKYIDQDDEESGGDSYTPDADGMSGLGGMGGMGGMPPGMGGMGGMPGMGGMGGMPGMGGMGGMPGMPGMGGDGNLDMSKLQEMMAASGGMPGGVPDEGTHRRST